MFFRHKRLRERKKKREWNERKKSGGEERGHLKSCYVSKKSKIYVYIGECINTGILRDKTMTDNLMYIPNDDTQNYPFCR